MAKEEKAVAQASEPKFPLERLQATCFELFGVPTSTFVGATWGLEGEFTKSEIKARIEDWGKKEAK